MLKGHPSKIAAGVCKARREPGLDRVRPGARHDDRGSDARMLHAGQSRTCNHDYVHVDSRQFKGNGATAFYPSFEGARHRHEVSAVHIAELTQPAQECRNALVRRIRPGKIAGSASANDDPNMVNLARLRLRLDSACRGEEDYSKTHSETDPTPWPLRG